MSHLQTPTTRYKETNPHFVTRQHPQGQHPRQQPQRHAQRPQQPPQHELEHSNPHFVTQQHPQGHHPRQQPQHHAQRPQQSPQHELEHPQQQPLYNFQRPQQQSQQQREHPQEQPQRHVQLPPQLPQQQREHPQQDTQYHGRHPQQHPQHQSQHTQQHPHSGTQSLRVPHPRRTKLLQWCLAIFCAVFWILIILGGLIVLIIYLAYRPQSPRFDLSSVTLNAAYLDMGYLLNADVTMLANFTNPNKKVRVDFSYVTLNLYYEDTLIATRYIEPFSASKKESRFADIHMVTSQVRLSVKDIQRLKRQIESNKILFQVKGFFRTRSNLGSFLRYSYWLYGHCSFVVTGPPNGVIVSKTCKTKR